MDLWEEKKEEWVDVDATLAFRDKIVSTVTHAAFQRVNTSQYDVT